MRVLHVSYIVGVSGAERRQMRSLSYLRAAGVDVRMLMLFKPHKPVPEFETALEAANVPVITLPVPYSNSLVNPHMIDIVRRMRQAIRAQQPDIVQTHQIYANLYGTIAARRAGVSRVIATRVNLADFYREPHWQVINWLLWKFRASGMANSEAVRRYVARYEHVAPGKLHTIPNAFDVSPDDGLSAGRRRAFREPLGIALDAPVVGSASRFVGWKELRYAVEAFAEIHTQRPDAHYVLAGDGPMRGDLELQAERLGLLGVVHFLGWRSDMDTVYDGIDVILHPAVGESFSNAVAEAMIHCVPVVAAREGGLSEIVVDGETGLLAAPNDALALVEPVLRLLDDHDLACRFGEAGRRRIEQVYSPERQVERYLRLYAAVMGEPAP